MAQVAIPDGGVQLVVVVRTKSMLQLMEGLAPKPLVLALWNDRCAYQEKNKETIGTLQTSIIYIFMLIRTDYNLRTISLTLLG